MNKVLAAIFILLVLNPAFAYDDHDFQVWNTEVEEFKINKDLKLALEEEFRWADNANEFYYQHYDLGVSYSLKKWLSLSGGYRHVIELKKKIWRTEYESYLAAALSWEVKGFKLEDRSRFEYRHFDYQTDSWRYRNKFTVKLPWKFTKMEIQPYVADEVFFGSTGKSFNQNRFSSGLAFNITKNLKGEIYYILQSTRGKLEWTDANILGTKFKLAF